MDRLEQSELPALDEATEVSAPETCLEEAPAGMAEDPLWVIARLLWQRRGFLGRVTLGALLLATLVAFLIPKRYTSSTRIMSPDTSQSSAAMLAALAGKSSPRLAAAAGELLGVRNSGAVFTGLLQGRTIQDRLVERFDLRKVYWDRYWDDAREDLRKRTDISEDRKSGIITINVTDRDPRRAAAIAKAYVEELDRLVAQVSTSSARQERIFIEQRLQSVKVDLDRAEKAFSQFASKNAALDIKEQMKAMVTSAAELQAQLIAAQSQLQGLEQIYTPYNVRVRSLRARVAELQRQLTKLGGTDTALAASGQNELYPSIRKLPLLAVEWGDLYREAKVQETVYELLTQQYELARIEEAKEVPVVRVADAANIPEKKSFPPRLLIIAAATLLSLAAAAKWVTAVQRWQTLDPQDSRKVFLTDVGVQIATQAHRLKSTMRQRGSQAGHESTHPRFG